MPKSRMRDENWPACLPARQGSQGGAMLPQCEVRFEQLEAMREDIVAIRRAVVGNGNPERSLATRVARMEVLWKIFGILATLGVVVASLYTAFG